MSENDRSTGAGLEPQDPTASGGDKNRPVERDRGPLQISPTIGGAGGSGSVVELPEGVEEGDDRA